MDKRKFWRNLTRIHKWAGLVLGIQIMLWFSSGFFMSFFDIDKVRGRHLADKQAMSLPAPETLKMAKPEAALKSYLQYYKKPATTLSLKHTPIGSYYQLSGKVGELFLDGQALVKWPGLGEDEIQKLARKYYKGKGSLERVRKLERAPKEYGGDVPVWQVIFDDKAKTRLYLSPVDGELKSVRTRLWRIYDFMWMLHIMDYKDRKNFNNWWLRLLAGAAVLFGLTGIGLVIHRVFLRPRPKKP